MVQPLIELGAALGDVLRIAALRFPAPEVHFDKEGRRRLAAAVGAQVVDRLGTHSLRTLLDGVTTDAPNDYNLFTERQKELLGAMHNNVLALGRLLKLKPGEVVDL